MTFTTIELISDYVNPVTGIPMNGYIAIWPSSDLLYNGAVIFKAIPQQINVVGGSLAQTYQIPTTDNSGITPAGWYWNFCEVFAGMNPNSWSAFIPSTYGATVNLAAIPHGSTMTPPLYNYVTTQYAMEITGAATTGYVLTATGGGSSQWEASGGGSGAVSSVFGRTGAVIAQTGDYSAFYDPSGAASTAQTNAESFATSAVSTETTRAEAAESTNATAISTETSRAQAAEALKLAKASNLSDVANAAIALSNLGGLGVGATAANSSAIDGVTVTGTPSVNYVPTATSGSAATWQALPSAPVSSVFGRTGTVTAATNDYSFAQISGTISSGQVPTLNQSTTGSSGSFTGSLVGDVTGTQGATVVSKIQGTTISAPPGGTTSFLAGNGTWQTPVGAVTSVFGRTGVVVSATNDYSFSQISGTLGISQGGTGSGTQNFVDLTTTQNIAGVKNFTTEVTGPTPVNVSDLVTKAYADAIAQGLSLKFSCQEGTTAALPANTYLSGVLTATAPGVLVVDGITVALNDRILSQNEVVAAHNGIYSVTTLGTVSVPYVLTRTTDMNANNQVAGAFTFVEQGTVNANAGFAVAGIGPFTIGTTAINWTQFSGAGEITAGTGLTKTGNTLALSTPVSVGNGGTGSATQNFMDLTTNQAISGIKTFTYIYEVDIPSDHGFAEWNFPQMSTPIAQTFTSGTVYGATIRAGSSKTVSKFGYNCNALCSTPTSGENLMALYSVSGTTWTQIAVSGDLGTWGSTSSTILTAFSASVTATMIPGNIYAVLWLSVGATAVSLRGVGNLATWANGGTTNAASPGWYKFFTVGTSQTTLPASFAASSMSIAGALTPWFCLA